MNDNLEYYRNRVALARTEIKNLRQQMSALKHEHQKEVHLIKSSLNKLSCANCAAEATTTRTAISDSNGASNQYTSEVINYNPIGYIETSFHTKRGVPRQPTIVAMAQGVVVVNNAIFNNPEHALSELAEFSHMWIIFHFHATESTNIPAKVSPPRLQGERRGVFSTRSPHRPCPIGLSLVKIVKIEGNKIHFLGVDMMNGTPVLDIKPYIPQYDYPTPVYGENTMSSLMRPPTEGISDATEVVANMAISDNRLSPHLRHPMGITAGSPRSQSPFEDGIPSPDTQNNLAMPISPSLDSPPSGDLSVRPRSPLRRPDTERGAPDGQERFTPPQSAYLLNMAHDGIRVAPWISNPPTQSFEVRFTGDALGRLNELIGDRAQAFKANLECLLSEDPRSQYVRTRYPDHEYSCVLEDLSISCVFDNANSVCTIVTVRSAEELQQT